MHPMAGLALQGVFLPINDRDTRRRYHGFENIVAVNVRLCCSNFGSNKVGFEE
jgi:hypothetical protein